MTDDETIALRATVIAGKRYEDDFTVIWRGVSIGRIMKTSGVPTHLAQWSWSCSVHGKPGASANGNGVDLEHCKAQFKAAWAAIRDGLSEETSRARESTPRTAVRRWRNTSGRDQREPDPQ